MNFFRHFTIGSWKFFLSGNGMSLRTGRYVGRGVALGVLVGFVTVAFRALIDLMARGVPLKTLAADHRWALLVLPSAGALAGHFLLKCSKALRHARGTDSAVWAFHHNDGRITRSVIPVKSVASVLTVGTGGSAGYEGPVTLLGAACGSMLAGWLRLEGRARRVLMASGLAAGIGALFQAPLAGALFGAEIFYSSSDLEYDAILPGFVTSAVAYTIFACFYGWHPLFSMPDYTFTNGVRLFPYIGLAFVVTLGARFYISVFRGTEAYFTRLLLPAWIKVTIGGLACGALAYALPEVAGPGYDTIQSSILAGDAAALAAGMRDWPIHGFLLFFVLKVLATSCTVGSGGSGGVFAPALVCGASLGAATGIAFANVLPASVGIHPAAFALVGMAGFTASAVRVPLTSIVMVAEISGNHALLLPTMWVCGIAFWLNNGWSLYRSQPHDRDGSPVYQG